MTASPILTSNEAVHTVPKGRLFEKVAIVTGGSGGIGRAICLAYASEGARIVVADLKDASSTISEQDATTVDQIKKQGGHAFFVKTDVTDSESVDSLVRDTVSRWGRVDIMVNNAGIALEASDPRPIWEVDNEYWRKTHAVNSNGVFYGVRAASARMIKQEPHPSGDRGWIINMASIYGLVAFPHNASYGSSKHLVMGLTKAAALDLAPYRVHVNAICPGHTHSSMTRPYLEDPTYRASVAERHPFRGLGEPKDIAQAAVFLASDDARWVTAIGLSVDGGYTAQ